MSLMTRKLYTFKLLLVLGTMALATGNASAAPSLVIFDGFVGYDSVIASKLDEAKSEVDVVLSSKATSGDLNNICVYPGGESHFSPSTAEIIAVHGGTFFLNSRDGSPDSTTAPEGAVVDPERWINQARKIDPPLLQQLQHFTAYPAKDSRF